MKIKINEAKTETKIVVLEEESYDINFSLEELALITALLGSTCHGTKIANIYSSMPKKVRDEAMSHYYVTGVEGTLDVVSK